MPADPICDHSLIVCATQRSGSSFLSESLGLIGIGDPNEWLTLESINHANTEAGLPPNAPIKESIRLIMKRRVQERIFSVKIMWDSLTYLINRLTQDEPEKAHFSIDQWFLELFPNPKLIYIHRENIVKQAVSLAKAHLSDHWLSSTQKEIDPFLVRFNFGMIHREVGFLTHRNHLWQSFLAQTAIPWFDLKYESFIHDYEDTLSAIAQFWGIPTPPIDRSKTKQKRMSDGLNQAWTQQYEQWFASARPKFSPTRASPLPPEQILGRITPNQPKILAHPNERGFVAVNLTNLGSTLWPNIAQEDLKGSVALTAKIIDPSSNQSLSEYTSYLPCDLSQNQSALVEFSIITPPICGSFELSFSLVQIGIGPLSNPHCPSSKIALSTIPTFNQRRIQLKFPQATPTTWGWYHDPAFGDFQANAFPWLFHQELGWIFCPGTDSQHYWFYDTQLGLLHTSPSDFPFLYSDRLQTWLEYHRHSKSPRRFSRLDNEEIIEVPFYG